jgi:hypothetical protein
VLILATWFCVAMRGSIRDVVSMYSYNMHHSQSASFVPIPLSLSLANGALCLDRGDSRKWDVGA